MPLAELLDRLIAILESHRSPRVDWLRETAALLDRDPEAFWARLNSAAFWGGANSIANEALADTPEIVNNDPYGDGWLFSVRLDEPSEIDELMDAEAYREHVDEA